MIWNRSKISISVHRIKSNPNKSRRKSLVWSKSPDHNCCETISRSSDFRQMALKIGRRITVNKRIAALRLGLLPYSSRDRISPREALCMGSVVLLRFNFLCVFSAVGVACGANHRHVDLDIWTYLERELSARGQALLMTSTGEDLRLSPLHSNATESLPSRLFYVSLELHYRLACFQKTVRDRLSSMYLQLDQLKKRVKQLENQHHNSEITRLQDQTDQDSEYDEEPISLADSQFFFDGYLPLNLPPIVDNTPVGSNMS